MDSGVSPNSSQIELFTVPDPLGWPRAPDEGQGPPRSCPRATKESPRGSQEGPKGAQEQPKSSQGHTTMAQESPKSRPRAAQRVQDESRTGSGRGSRDQYDSRTEIGSEKRAIRGYRTSESAVRVIDFSVAGLCARSTTTDAKTELEWSRNRSRKQHKAR